MLQLSFATRQGVGNLDLEGIGRSCVILSHLIPFALATSPIVMGQRMPTLPEASHAKLMILGTFHFDDGGLDGYKPKYRLDILSSKRQVEIRALLEALAKYRPNQIAVEWRVEHRPGLDAEFRKYLAVMRPALDRMRSISWDSAWRGC